MRRIPHAGMLLALLHAAALLFSPAAPAQDYPARTIKIVVPFSPGGGVDLLARMIADKLRAKWKQPAIVENRTGAAGIIAAEYVARSAPDGYTVFLATTGQYVTNKLLFKKLNYDPDAMVPVAVTTTVPFNLIMNPAVPARSVQELIAHMKANPNKLTYASSGVGTTLHLTGELFQSMAGVKMVHVPYKGTAPAMSDLLSGQVDMIFMEIHGALPHMTAGRVRVLATAAERRLSFLPELPALSEVLPGFLATIWTGVAAPAGTPAAVVSRLSAGIVEAMKQPDVAKRLSDEHVEVVAGGPAEMAALIRQDEERWGAVIRATGATAN